MEPHRLDNVLFYGNNLDGSPTYCWYSAHPPVLGAAALDRSLGVWTKYAHARWTTSHCHNDQ